MIETKGQFELRGESFGHQVLIVKASDVDKFMEVNKNKFAPSGLRSLLRALSVPASFYEKLDTGLQGSIITSQKSSIQGHATELAILRDKAGELVYGAAVGPMGIEDPTTLLHFNKDDWRAQKVDLERGYIRYHGYGKLILGEYHPCLWAHIPILYSRPLTIELGMFKLNCSNGAVDATNAGKIQLNPKMFKQESWASTLVAMRTIVQEVEKGYKDFTSYLTNKKVTVDDAKQMLGTILNDHPGMMPKTLIMRCFRHVDLVENKKEVEKNSPSKIESMMDVFDMFTFYSQSLISLPGQAVAERRIFDHFYTNATKDNLGGYFVKKTEISKKVVDAGKRLLPKDEAKAAEDAPKN